MDFEVEAAVARVSVRLAESSSGSSFAGDGDSSLSSLVMLERLTSSVAVLLAGFWSSVWAWWW